LNKEKAEYPIYRFISPITLKIEFLSTSMADVACLMPKVKRLDGRTIEYVDNDFAVMFEAIMALVTLAYSANIS
jgi:D-amino peptidase